MRRTTLAALAFLPAFTGCFEPEKEEKAKDELQRAPAIQLPAPGRTTFGANPPPEPPPAPAPGAQTAALAAPAEPAQTETALSRAQELPNLTVEPAVTLNTLFERYAACYGMDWRFLRAVAQAESGLNPRNHTGKHIGLFQLASDPRTGAGGETCEKFVEPFKSYLDCSNLEDPEANTAVAAHRFDRAFKGRRNWARDPDYRGILEVCPDATVEEAVALAYVGHNNGPGVLRYILTRARANGWCRLGKHEEAVRAYYRDPRIGNDEGWYEKPEAGREPRACHNQAELRGQWSYHCVTEDYGARKYRYGLTNVARPVKEAGVDRLYGPEDASKCPALQVPPRRLMPRPS